MGLVFALAVAVGPGSSGHSVAHGTASPGATASASPSVTAPDTAGTVPAQDSAPAKLAAETTVAANPVADALGSAQQPSWSAKPRVLHYLGYQFQVPSSWPVYNLATDSSKCVLFSIHAVYLGTPGSGQDCPASALGRTEALLIQPASSASTSASAIVVGGGTAALSEDAALPAATTATHMFQVDIPKAGVLVTATYGTNEAGLRSILAGATITGQTAASGTSTHVPGSGSSGPGSSGSAALGGSATPTASSAAGQSLMTVGATSSAATSSAQTSSLTSMVGSGLGLDTCTVPSTSTMTKWLASPYRVIGTYLGGMNWACGYGNFSASWVSHTAAQGWRFVPLWVGRQAPCSTIPGVAVINPAQATAEGQAEANSAVGSAREFGFGKGTPIYFDMEGYNPSGSCSRAVVNFLGGWTRALHAAGYVSGVYASAASGIKDLVAAYRSSGSSRPDDIWTADWNGEPVLTDSYVPGTYWSNHQRLHQYSGPHGEKWGGATLNIDSDAADGPVVGQSSIRYSAGPAESATPSELTAAPGSTAKVTLTLHGLPKTSIDVQWQVGVPRGMSATPSSGAVDLTAGGAYTATVSLTPATSLAPGRYLVPITVSASSHTIAEAYVLATVVRSGGSLPTGSPLVLYAADKGDMVIAARIAGGLALPASSVTGTFKQAWRDAAGNKDLVIAVGEPAANALYFNVCGWTDPAGWPAGSTPFYYTGYPLRSPPGRNYFELASTPSTAATTQLTTQLTQYALTGTLPGYGSQLVAPTPPGLNCEGSANVPVR
jgi:Rv2525c-like, glycoside hydrolase-like domain